jgi:predicted RNA-binding protein with RPS1 domain
VSDEEIPASVQQRLGAEAERHAKATISRSLEQNNVHFNQAREKLEKWADDMVLSAEKALAAPRSRSRPYGGRRGRR